MLVLGFRTRRFAFAVVQSPPELLDWGVRSLPTVGAYEKVWDQVSRTARRFSPSLLIVRELAMRTKRQRPELRAVLRRLRVDFTLRGTTTVMVRNREVYLELGKLGCMNKHAIGLVVTRRFPEIAWMLRPQKKPWQTEFHNAVLFDAIAAAITYSARSDLPTEPS